jgi:UDP-3-O-[3-hydroxymyristoyl] glucosamine N-acyltransferase
MLVSELARLLGVAFEGNGNTDIGGAAPLEAATATDLAFVNSPKHFPAAERSEAGCLVAPADFPNAPLRPVLRSENPRGLFAAALRLLYPDPELVPGIHPSADIHQDARVDPTAQIGPRVSVGARASVGARCKLGPGCAVGSGSSVGDGSVLHANVTIYPLVTVGRRCVLHSGSVIGADGFGFVLTGDRYQKFPQVGRVEIGDDVEIGANTCIDRAALGVTTIGDGTKLDNLVHIGHNCRLGKHVVIAAQTGLSGGVVVEDYAVIGGQVGIGDKARIESRAVLGSGCGILTSKIVRAGQVVWGTPARPLKEYLQQLAHLSRLPELRRELRELRARIEVLGSR